MKKIQGGKYCSVIGCNSKRGKTSAVMFHRFPLKDPVRLSEWLKLCPPHIVPRANIAMCSKHFRKDQYLNFNVAKPKLIHNAVPFLPDHLKALAQEEKQAEPIKPAICNTNEATHLPVPITSQNVEEDVAEPIHSQAREEDGVVTLDIPMKNDDSGGEEPAESPEETRGYLFLENIRLKETNQELESQLKRYQQRLALMEGHVHRLSRLAGEADCVCSFCTDFLIN